MPKRRNQILECSLCKVSKSGDEFTVGQTIRQPVVNEIQRVDSNWTPDRPICFACLNRFRAEHVRQLLKDEKGELTALEEQVVDSLREQESVSGNVYEEFEHQLTLANRLSDRLASFGGSWTFLIVFSTVVVGWVLVNTALHARQPFDPFPFILLNLLLSCLAAVQAPLILMSQNRQDAKDRLRSEHDYRVNLKAELEVRLLHTKMDQLLTHQWERLLEIQELQMELMEDVANRPSRGTGK